MEFMPKGYDDILINDMIIMSEILYLRNHYGISIKKIEKIVLKNDFINMSYYQNGSNHLSYFYKKFKNHVKQFTKDK